MKPMDPAVKLADLLAYVEEESNLWRQWFAKNPVALDVELHVAQATSAALLVQHIVAVDLRYAERLLGETVTPYEKLPTDAPALFEIGDTAFVKMKRFLESAKEEDWDAI